jgi:DNA-binding MarR family transcriptional regulator
MTPRPRPAMKAPFDNESTAHRLVTALAKVGLALRTRAWQAAGERGLTPTQTQLLTLLDGGSAPGARLAQLAAGLGVTPATASEAVAALVRKGLVKSERAADDARARDIRLTRAGRQMARRAAGWTDFLRAAADTLEPGEQAVFLRGLVKMIRELQERGEIPVSRMCVTCLYFRPDEHPGEELPHHCAFVDAPFGDRSLRLDCGDHVVVPPDRSGELWKRFVDRGPDTGSGSSPTPTG